MIGCNMHCICHRRVPEDGLYVRPKHVGELTDDKKVLCNKLVWNCLKYNAVARKVYNIEFVIH